jgi:hypothetical protein
MTNKINEMRSILIYGKEGSFLMEDLSALKDWKLELSEIPNSFEYCLAKGEVKILLHITASNVISTSNVLPYDERHDQKSANEVLRKLSNDLDDVGISNVISASENDLL